MQTVQQVNQLTAQAADLNQHIQKVSNPGDNPGSLEDQRDEALTNLSNLIDTAVVYSNNGTVSVTTTNGTLLVSGNQSDALTTQVNSATGMNDVFAQGTDITSSIAGGQLQGLINARDDSIPSAQSSLDNLAAGLISAVNTATKCGLRSEWRARRGFLHALYALTPGSNAGAAATMTVAITNPDQVAASSDGTSGDNSNATALADLQNHRLCQAKRRAITIQI